MSYLDTPAFKAKTDAYRKESKAMREQHARNMFDAETADADAAISPAEFVKKLQDS